MITINQCHRRTDGNKNIVVMMESTIPLSLTSLIVASSGFDAVFVGVADSFAAAFNGMPEFLHGLDGVVALLVFVASSGFDADSVVLVGVDNNFAATCDGVPVFLHGLDGIVALSVETAADFNISFVFVSATLVTHILSLISFTLLHLCCKGELESAVKLAKLVARLRLVLVLDNFCPEERSVLAFGKVFGAEERSSDKFKSFRGDSGSRCNTADGETCSSTFFVLFDGDGEFSCISLHLL